MNKRILLTLAGVLMASHAFAAEIRSPWSGGCGPIRYVFEELHKDRCNMNWWSSAHSKYANRAFIKHGTSTKEITELIFGKSEFMISDALADGTMTKGAVHYNPFVSRKQLTPRVKYDELGMTVGGSIDYPVWKDQGRIGVRVSVPFRQIEMERVDNGLSQIEDPTSDFVSRKLMTVSRQGDGAAAVSPVPTLATAYRLDLLELLTEANGNNIAAGGANTFTVFGADLATTIDPAANDILFGNYVAMTGSDPKTGLPLVHGYGLTDGAAAIVGGEAGVGGKVYDPTDASTPIKQLNTAFDNFPRDADSLVAFDSAAGPDYSNFITKPGFIANKSKAWLIFRRSSTQNAAGFLTKGGGTALGTDASRARNAAGIIDNLELGLQQYNENAFLFLSRAGVSLDSVTRTGLGDVDADLFYRHNLNNEWMGEICAGVRVPTGSSNKSGNPYKPMLGNGKHWEAKVGGLLAYQPLSWMNIKVDGSWNFVLQATETRLGTFKGSKVRNFGPAAEADVTWGYFIGRADVNLFYPKTSDIRATIGYELYYKTQDDLMFKKKAITPLEGKLRTAPVGGGSLDNLKTLDSDLARANSESITHKARFEASYQMSTYFELFAGGSIAFAGQNALADRDAHGGMNIRF